MFLKLVTFTLLLSMWKTSLASPPSLTYQGRIIKSDGTPLEHNNVSFIFKITDPSGQCILYQEQVNSIDMTNSSGVFDVPIGLGSVSYSSPNASTLLDVFNNSFPFTCFGGTPYSPVNTDGRLLRVSFYDGVGWNAITPDNKIRSVPYAAYALSAQKLGDKVVNDFLTKAGLPVCALGTFLTWDGAAMTCAAAGGGSGTVTSISTGTGLTGGPIANTGTISLANTAVTPGSYSKANITVDAQGRLTSASNGAATNLASEVSGVLPIANGGTNSSAVLTNNRVMASIGGAIVETAAITANKALVSDANGLPTHSSVSNTELNYLAGVTSSVQTQIDSKTSATGWTNYSVMGTNGAGNLVAVPGATANTMLQWSLTGPVWSLASYPASTTANQLLYSSANNIVAGLPTANNAVLTTNGSGAPSWSVLSNDSFSQYALLAGRAGGQTLNGGTAASENLILDSTANATKGNVLLNPTAGKVGIGTATPAEALDVTGNTKITGVGPTTGITALTVALNATDTSMTVADTSAYPSSGNLLVNTEVIGYTGKTATTFTGLTRGALSTTAASAGINTRVSNLAFYLNSSNANLIKISNNGSMAFGGGSMNGSYQTIAMGGGSATGQNWAIAMGRSATATGDGSIAVGRGNSTGFNTFAAGVSTASGGAATALGYFTTASGGYSTTTGLGTTAAAFGETAVGLYNKPKGGESGTAFAGGDPLFVVGNGTNTVASNALMVFQNGQMLVNGNTTVAIPAGSAALNAMGATMDSTAASFNATDSAGSSKLYVRNDGNVGVGLTSPAAKLNVAGAIVSAPSDVPSGDVVDLSLSNTTTLAAVGGSVITLNNMVHGGTYTLVIQDTTARTYTFTGCNTSKFKPANASTTAGTHSIYTILTVYNGASYDCYITWATGYQ